MKPLKSILFEDTFHLSGMIFILISALIFSVGALLIPNKDFQLSSFFICYAITVVFTFTVLIRTIALHSWRIRRGKLEYTALMLIFWLISAFALNKEMSIFDNSANWLSIYLCIAGTAVIAATFYDLLSSGLKHVLLFLLGMALVLFTYFALYLTPLYAIGALAAAFLGISAHVYAPVLLALVIVAFTIRFIKQTPALKYAFLAGLAFPLMICICFILKWNTLYNKVIKAQNHHTLSESKLPQWVAVAQQLPQSHLVEKFMKADLVYTTPNNSGNWFWGDFSQNSFGESRKHDPLVMTAALFIGKSSLEEADRIRVLKAVFDSRHLAQERLWSGDDLLTTNVVSNVKIYPGYRMAYTEKTISIKNTNIRQWSDSQEAIYTFHLPEGAVVSSLSLWVNGREEKARLSTKSKAGSAYKTIVGVEARDPSVVHWQEGNTVSVRVFPCTNKEQRKFKIGITTPLLLQQKRLIYQNTYFYGPNPEKASESIRVKFSAAPRSLDTDLEEKDGQHVADRKYQDQWQLSIAAVPLSKGAFTFAGSGYQLEEAATENNHFTPAAIYLDLNNAWSRQELETVWQLIKMQKVYAFDERMVQITVSNLDEVYEKSGKLNFSLFPFYKIADPETALIISKSNPRSPNLSDLDASDFQHKTTRFLAKTSRLHLYNIGDTISPYLKTLKQFGIFRYSSGNLQKLSTQLKQNRFNEIQQVENAVNIASSGTVIKKSAGITGKDAPDHLLRLYAYNDILKKIGPAYFEKNYVSDDLLSIADQGFIVSPVSSLIVLETKKDYERFDIDESKNSLNNASFKSSGAAPEPHEWVLLLLSAAVMLYFIRQSPYFSKFKLKWNW